MSLTNEIIEVAIKLGTVRDDYFGGNFEGNETRKLLENTHMIREVLEDNLHIFVDCMESLQKLRKSCFGFTLDENYKQCIKDFEDDWKQLNFEFGVAIPNKCHIIFEHLEDFIERHKKPLGEFSEEVVEAAHQRLDQIWQWYLVKMVEKEIFTSASITSTH